MSCSPLGTHTNNIQQQSGQLKEPPPLRLGEKENPTREDTLSSSGNKKPDTSSNCCSSLLKKAWRLFTTPFRCLWRQVKRCFCFKEETAKNLSENAPASNEYSVGQRETFVSGTLAIEGEERNQINVCDLPGFAEVTAAIEEGNEQELLRLCKNYPEESAFLILHELLRKVDQEALVSHVEKLVEDRATYCLGLIDAAFALFQVEHLQGEELIIPECLNGCVKEIQRVYRYRKDPLARPDSPKRLSKHLFTLLVEGSKKAGFSEVVKRKIDEVYEKLYKTQLLAALLDY